MAKAVRKKIKVILQNSLRNIGKRGDIKEVAKGFFFNFLEPKKYALRYTDEIANNIKNNLDRNTQEHDIKMKEALSVQTKLNTLIISCVMSASGTGVLYSSVNKKYILTQLQKQVNYNYKSIEIHGPIKKTGLWYVTVDIFEEISVKIPILVEKTEDDLKNLEHKFKKGELNE